MPSDEINTIKREVLHITNETSDKFVLAPTKEHVLSDLIIDPKYSEIPLDGHGIFKKKRERKMNYKIVRYHKLRSMAILALMKKMM